MLSVRESVACGVVAEFLGRVFYPEAVCKVGFQQILIVTVVRGDGWVWGLFWGGDSEGVVSAVFYF